MSSSDGDEVQIKEGLNTQTTRRLRVKPQRKHVARECNAWLGAWNAAKMPAPRTIRLFTYKFKMSASDKRR
jgi:hypothetical protein